jgi:hypothetical protein
MCVSLQAYAASEAVFKAQDGIPQDRTLEICTGRPYH